MKHTHQIQRDALEEKLERATQLGDRKIPTAMTWPLAEIKRALREAVATWLEAKQIHQDAFTVGTRDRAGKLKPAPVYARNPDGSPVWKLDDKTGEPTTEREIIGGKISLTNKVEHDRELRDLGKGMAEIRVPHLSWTQLEGKVPSLEPNIVEALMEFFDDAPHTPDDRAEATREAKPATRPRRPQPAAR